MRKFSYITDYSLLSTTIKGYLYQLELEINYLKDITNNEIYDRGLQIINSFKDNFPNLNTIRDTILNDLLNPRNIEYYYKNNKYPSDASEIGMEIEKELKKIFILEEELKNFAINYWENDLTSFDNITNGEDFMVVGHASYILPGTPDNFNYRSNNLNKQYLSCSLFSNNELNSFNNFKTIYIVSVNKDNYISSSGFDTVTFEPTNPSFHTVKEINIDGNIHYIDVGYSYDLKKSVTTISIPKLIEKLSIKRELEQNGELFSYDNSLTNEIVLDRTKTKIDGALLLSNGCDLLLQDYLYLKQHNVKFKCINKGLYRMNNGLPEYTDKEFNQFKMELLNINNFLLHNCLSIDFLINYYEDVVVSMKYSDYINKMIIEEFSKYIDISLIESTKKR